MESEGGEGGRTIDWRSMLFGEERRNKVSFHKSSRV